MSALKAARVEARPCARPRASRKAVICRAQQQTSLTQKLASASAAVVLSLSALSGAPAIASEFDLLGEPTPTDYYVDDASVLSKATRSEINKRLKLIEIQSGVRLEVVTVRKLEFETDAFAFADKIAENWYPGDALKNKGVLVAVTTSKEGAISAGKDFVAAVGEDLLDSIIGENIPVLTEQEKYNAAVLTSVDRFEAKINGQAVPDAPKRNEVIRERNYRTKEETEKSKNVTSTVVLTLLFIAVVVPMLQYYGYTAKD